jgi:hypothetical protein
MRLPVSGKVDVMLVIDANQRVASVKQLVHLAYSNKKCAYVERRVVLAYCWIKGDNMLCDCTVLVLPILAILVALFSLPSTFRGRSTVELKAYFGFRLCSVCLLNKPCCMLLLNLFLPNIFLHLVIGY